MDQVPANYIRKQTLANCERYITQELKELENQVLTAKDRLTALEYQIFTCLCGGGGGYAVLPGCCGGAAGLLPPGN